MSRMLEGWEN